jgi:hypothetical protein
MRVFSTLALAALLGACEGSLVTPGGTGQPVTPPPAPSLIQMSPSAPVVGQTISFSDGGVLGGSQLSRTWRFSDDYQVEGATVARAFLAPGRYWVELRVSAGVESRTAALQFEVFACCSQPETGKTP